jgi:hypothetical protein
MCVPLIIHALRVSVRFTHTFVVIASWSLCCCHTGFLFILFPWLQKEFFRIYLTSCGVEADEMEEQMERLYEETQFFIMVVHFFWALWSVASLCTSDVEFDYLVSRFI